jgi:hypothetical protein
MRSVGKASYSNACAKHASQRICCCLLCLCRQLRLDWLIKKDFFWTNMRRQKTDDAAPQDPMEKIFGTIIPQNIPESFAA